MSAFSVPVRWRWTPPPAGRAWAARNSFALRLAAALIAIGAAYHYSLLTLVRALGLETPAGLPGAGAADGAAGWRWLRARPDRGEPSIHDREVDVIVGVPLLLAALAS